jgi:hypothetical protein
MCYGTPDCGQRPRNSRLTRGNLAPEDVDNGRCPIGENFLYGFQGRAERAARLAARNRARERGGRSGDHNRKRAPRARGNPPHHAAAARLTAKAHGGGRRGTDPGQLAVLAERRNPPRVRERAILPARALLKPSKITVKAACDRSTTATGQDDQVHVHAKTTLTVIFHRFYPAPVGRMARTGLASLRPGRKMQVVPVALSYLSRIGQTATADSRLP